MTDPGGYLQVDSEDSDQSDPSFSLTAHTILLVLTRAAHIIKIQKAKHANQMLLIFSMESLGMASGSFL